MAYEKYFLKDVKEESSKKLFTVVSCFAGGGGSSTGYRLGGGDVLMVNEFVEEAIKTYSLNFPDTKVLVDDIKKYSGQDFLDKIGLKKGELDILDGSPPCSAFSVAGSREKGWGKTKSYSDGKVQENIEDLFLEFIRVAKDVQPKVIVAENVKGITFGEAKKKRNLFINAFEEIGYSTTYKVLNAADYGVPQARERTIFICIRNDVCDTIGMNLLNIFGVFPEQTVDKHVSIKECLEDLVIDEEQVKMLRDYIKESYQMSLLERMPFNPKKTMSAAHESLKDINPKGSYFNLIRPCPDKPSPTITQAGNQLSPCGVVHFAENRKYTIGELKRIMGLPDDYILSGTFNQQSERIGRMVAPKMMAEVAKSIYTKVLKPYNEAKNG